MAHSCNTRNDRVSPARVPHEPFLHYPLRRVRRLIQQSTFLSDVRVNSVYIHDTRTGHQQVVKEGQPGWVLQTVFSRASFRRITRNGKSYSTMMSLHINNQYAKKRGIAKNLLLAVRAAMHQEQVDMVASDFHGATWRSRRRLPTRTCQFLMALQLCGDQVAFQENGPMCAVSSSHLVPKLSGTFARTVRSKSLTKLFESNIPTRVSTTKYGSVSYMSTHGWLIAHPEMGNIGGHSSGKRNSPYDQTTWPSAQENHVAIRARKRDNSRMPPRCPRRPRCSARKFMSAAIRFNTGDH